MSGEFIDLASQPPGDEPGRRSPQASPAPRRFLGVHFACCDVYTRVYINRDQTAYTGHCPRCGGTVQFRVGPGGTAARFFRAQ